MSLEAPITHAQIVDTEAAQEFMREALSMVSRPEVEAVGEELEAKSRRFSQILEARALLGLSDDRLRALLRSIFATRRRSDQVIATVGPDQLRHQLWLLLHDAQPVESRLDHFDQAMAGLDQGLRRDLAGEVLHFCRPWENWLWTRWIWDPTIGTGALPLVTTDEYDLHGASAGQIYLRVGRATAFVNRTGRSVGFTRFGSEAMGVDVYLACVYSIYLYTVTRLRMTQEFNKVLPGLPELVRRLLGTHRMEV